MSYRGEDLDLRTPRTWSATPADLAGWSQSEPALNGPRPRATYGAARGGPIWVDDTVLACVNHAFDVALAHRAGDVRLEHLLHALTRIDAAAEALEARGVRVAALRRESATVIASEIPVGLTNGKSAPRRSEELEHVLRAASAMAARRNAPVGIDDLLQLILDVEPDLPGLALLNRIAPRPAMPPPEPVYQRPLYAQDPPRYMPEPRYSEAPEPMRERPRPAPAYYSEPPAASARPQRQEFSATPTDNIQNSRLDALEQMVRAVSGDLSNERTVFSSLLQDLQRDVTAQREDHSLAGGGLTDRLAAVERALVSGFDSLNEQVQSLEAASDTRPIQIDLAPLTNRLDIIEEAVLSRESEPVTEIVANLKKLEDAIVSERTRVMETSAVLNREIATVAQAIENQEADLATALLTPVAEKLDRISALGEARSNEASQGLKLLSERIVAVETAVSSYAAKSADAQTANAGDLQEVHDALMKLNANQHTLASAIEQWRTEGRQTVTSIASEVAGFGQRFANLETEATKPMAMLEALTTSVDKMHRVTVERYHRRNRFWYWLFGTDDWLAASWPSQAHRIGEELRAVKPMPVKK